MDERFSRLVVLVFEQGGKLDAGLQSMEDKMQEFKSEMYVEFAARRSEMTELLRLNRPPPLVIDPSSVHGRGQASHHNHGEGS